MTFQPLTLSLSMSRSLVPPAEADSSTFEEDDLHRQREQVECDTPAKLLDALADADSRKIIDLTAVQPVSVARIVDQCDIPTPTAYRKVNDLVELGLLDKQIQIRTTGTNYFEYALRVGSIDVSVGANGTPRARYRTQAVGGESQSDSPSKDTFQAVPAERKLHRHGREIDLAVPVDNDTAHARPEIIDAIPVDEMDRTPGCCNE